MSKSTPLSQLQSVNTVPLNTIPEAEAAINEMNIEFGGTNQIQSTVPMQVFPQQQVVQEPVRKPEFISKTEIKLFVTVVVLYLLISNHQTVNILCNKIPGMSNPYVCLFVRAILIAILIVIINKFV
jgi:hypothetical protein